MQSSLSVLYLARREPSLKEAGCALIHTNFAWNLEQKILRITAG